MFPSTIGHDDLFYPSLKVYTLSHHCGSHIAGTFALPLCYAECQSYVSVRLMLSDSLWNRRTGYWQAVLLLSYLRDRCFGLVSAESKLMRLMRGRDVNGRL